MILAIVATGLLACSEPRPTAKMKDALPNLPLPPSSQVLSREGGEDAISIRFHSDEAPDMVAGYYRLVLGKAPWKLVSDEKMADGSLTLYAEQKGPSLWVTIRKADSVAAGSIVELAGAKSQ
jgi:hypothetical protein